MAARLLPLVGDNAVYISEVDMRKRLHRRFVTRCGTRARRRSWHAAIAAGALRRWRSTPARVTIAARRTSTRTPRRPPTSVSPRRNLAGAVAGAGLLGQRAEARRARGVRDRHPRGDADVAEGRPRQEHAQGAEGRRSTRTSPSGCCASRPARRPARCGRSACCRSPASSAKSRSTSRPSARTRR